MSSTTNFNYKSLVFFFLFVFSVSLSSSRLLIDDKPLLEMHEDWMAHHGRVYKDAKEKEARFKIFKENVERINAFNKGENQGYELAVNQFADMTNEEFRARNSYKRQMKNAMPVSESTNFEHGNVSSVPETLDWRTKGAVTPVKDQGSCGCCWAFSAVAAIEGINQLKTGKLISLSEQELVDCDINMGDQGCEGGLMETAFKFIKQNKGLTTESNYPYVGADGTCKKQGKKPAAQITGYINVRENDENALLQAVTKQPVSVAIDASSFNFQFYSGGVFGGACETNLDHAVTAIGYGTETDGTKYWLVKNSWGKGWGDKGFMKIKRDVAAKEGECGIAMMSSYPTM